MALYFFSDAPGLLLSAFKAAVDVGRVATWSYDDDGDFTHDTHQWSNLAWLRPRVRERCLYLHILAPTDRPVSKGTYGVYHGRFVESMLTHCDDLFSRVRATALPTEDDVVG